MFKMSRYFLPQHDSNLGSKNKKCCIVACPCISVALIVGAFFGFSLVLIPDGHVGFNINDKMCENNSCSVKYNSPGLYLVFPWDKPNFRIVDTREGNLSLGMVGEKNHCFAQYSVSNIEDFLLTRVNLDSTFTNVLIEDVKKKLTESRDSQFLLYGCWFFNLQCE